MDEKSTHVQAVEPVPKKKSGDSLHEELSPKDVSSINESVSKDTVPEKPVENLAPDSKAEDTKMDEKPKHVQALEPVAQPVSPKEKSGDSLREELSPKDVSIINESVSKDTDPEKPVENLAPDLKAEDTKMTSKQPTPTVPLTRKRVSPLKTLVPDDSLSMSPLKTLVPDDSLRISPLKTLVPDDSLRISPLKTLVPDDSLRISPLKTLVPDDSLRISPLKTLVPDDSLWIIESDITDSDKIVSSLKQQTFFISILQKTLFVYFFLASWFTLQ
ncbi:uncharacterized protein [Amphiura filiformis]|uniref:uncharacterized protein isoform X2 n=1 Tax=Amphiura filiformis TaxID=82378 RepID=UPI003B212DFB